MRSFKEVFPVSKPIIGMIHLAGKDLSEKVSRAQEELRIFDSEGFDGAILENYHCNGMDLMNAACLIDKSGLKLKLGVNFLRGFDMAFDIANAYKFSFMQMDSVQHCDFNHEQYDELRGRFPDVAVLGGVGFKYTAVSPWPLEKELRFSRQRCEVIVTTGSGTGIETPLDKLRDYKKYLGDFPLIVGAGVTAENAYEQLRIADGAIVGSYLKNGDTRASVSSERCRELIDVVRSVRD